MSSESLDAALSRALPPALVPPAPIAAAPAPPLADAQQLRAVDAAFAQSDDEAAQAAGFLGFLAAGMLLQDVIHEHLAPPTDRVEVKRKKDDEEKS